MEYKFISSDCMEDIDLHDCSVSEFTTEGSSLILLFEYIYVLETHPLNPYGVAKYTGEARIQFIDYSIEMPYYIDNDSGSKIPVKFERLMFRFEMLKEEHCREDDGYFRYTFFGHLWHDIDAYFYGFQIRCKGVLTSWNELEGDAWFAVEHKPGDVVIEPNGGAIYIIRND